LGAVWWCKTITQEVLLTPEHTSFQWVEPTEALEIIENEGMKKDIELFIKEQSI
jgi:hypothetical protein